MSTDKTTRLGEWLSAYRKNRITAGPPDPLVTFAMVHEIDRLREAMAAAKAARNAMSQQFPIAGDPVEAAAIELWRQTKNNSADWSWDAVRDIRRVAYRRMAVAILSAAGFAAGLASENTAAKPQIPDEDYKVLRDDGGGDYDPATLAPRHPQP